MKLQFGSIIVQGAGKINGHQIRNFRGMPFLTKKAYPTKSNMFMNNPAKKTATLAFKYWATLTKVDRGRWSEIALKVPFFDRWGNVKYLNGRDLVSLLYINLTNAGGHMVDWNKFKSDIPSFSTDYITIDMGSQEVFVNNFVNDGGFAQLIYIANNPTAIRELKAKELKLICFVDIENVSEREIFTKIEESGFRFFEGKPISFGIRNVSTSGMVSPMQVFQVVPQH